MPCLRNCRVAYALFAASITFAVLIPASCFAQRSGSQHPAATRRYDGWSKTSSSSATASVASRVVQAGGQANDIPSSSVPSGSVTPVVKTAYYQSPSEFPSLPSMGQGASTGSGSLGDVGTLPAFPNQASPGSTSPANTLSSSNLPLPSALPMPSASPDQLPSNNAVNSLRDTGSFSDLGASGAGIPTSNAASSRRSNVSSFSDQPTGAASASSGPPPTGASHVAPASNYSSRNQAPANPIRNGSYGGTNTSDQPQYRSDISGYPSNQNVPTRNSSVPGQTASYQSNPSVSRTGPVLPDNSYSGISSPNRDIAQGGSSYQQQPYPTNSYQQPTSKGGLRTIDQQPQSDGRYARETIATGLPYVTPKPGNYMTAPYNPAFYQLAAYQRAVNTPQPSTQLTSAQVSNTQLANTQLPGTQPQAVAVQPQATLPQYAYTGVYPTAYQCSPAGPSFPSTGSVPGNYVPPTVTPNLAPAVYSNSNAGMRPLFSLGQENYNVQLGRGIVGQPTVYVPGQPVRNFFRYIFP